MMGRRRFYPPLQFGIVTPILMILFGLLVIIFPQIIAWLVGLYLIINGLVLLLRFI
ncbi:MAG: hypothetical protein J7K47_04285 [Thermoplasmata archaeon]|nr:hypothetical protein [Thermoplasmata archaeon]